MNMRSISTAFKNMWRNLLMSGASILSVTATLVILGIILLLVVNVNQITSELYNKIDIGTIYLDDGLTKEQINELQSQLEESDNIHSVQFISKEEAYNEFVQNFTIEDREYYKSIDNPLPNIFEIRMVDITKVDQLKSKLEKISGISKIKFANDLIKKIVRISNVVRNIAIVIVLILLLITILIINNTIRVGIASRSEELFIMRYVGATRSYIRWPYVIEGILLGFVGSIVSALILYIGYKEILLFIKPDLPDIVTATKFMRDINVLYSISILNIIIGAGVGLIGSIFSMRKYLKV